MKIIDAHTHFYPEIAAKQPEQWARETGEPYWGLLMGKRKDGKKSLQSFPSLSEFLQDMDNANISKAIIQGWYWENQSTCNIMNEAIADEVLKKHSDRLAAYAAICPSYFVSKKSVRDEILRLKALGFSGIGELHNGVQRFDIMGEKISWLSECCGEIDMPICFHATEKTDRIYLGKVDTETDKIISIAKKFPDTKFIIAHWIGGEIFKSEKMDIPTNIWTDSAAHPLLYKNTEWEKGCRIMGNRALFGTDYPLRVYPKTQKRADFDKILSNAIEYVPKELSDGFFSENFEALGREKKSEE